MRALSVALILLAPVVLAGCSDDGAAPAASSIPAPFAAITADWRPGDHGFLIRVDPPVDVGVDADFGQGRILALTPLRVPDRDGAWRVAIPGQGQDLVDGASFTLTVSAASGVIATRHVRVVASSPSNPALAPQDTSFTFAFHEQSGAGATGNWSRVNGTATALADGIVRYEGTSGAFHTVGSTPIDAVVTSYVREEVDGRRIGDHFRYEGTWASGGGRGRVVGGHDLEAVGDIPDRDGTPTPAYRLRDVTRLDGTLTAGDGTATTFERAEVGFRHESIATGRVIRGAYDVWQNVTRGDATTRDQTSRVDQPATAASEPRVADLAFPGFLPMPLEPGDHVVHESGHGVNVTYDVYAGPEVPFRGRPTFTVIVRGEWAGRGAVGEEEIRFLASGSPEWWPIAASTVAMWRGERVEWSLTAHGFPRA